MAVEDQGIYDIDPAFYMLRIVSVSQGLWVNSFLLRVLSDLLMENQDQSKNVYVLIKECFWRKMTLVVDAPLNPNKQTI